MGLYGRFQIRQYRVYVRVYVCTHTRYRYQHRRRPADIRVARVHAYSQQPSNFGVIQAIVLDGIVGVSGIA